MKALERMLAAKCVGIPVYNIANMTVNPDGNVVAWSGYVLVTKRVAVAEEVRESRELRPVTTPA